METTLSNELGLSQAQTDAIDVEFAVNGDTRAFERLYRRHVPRINSLARWLLGKDEVDDVIQDVFVRMWEKLHTFRGKSAFSTWLHRLATNVILRRREQHGVHEWRHSGTGHDLGRACATAESPGLRVDLESAVDQLPEGARLVFVLHDVEGYKHREVAEMLGISVGTSRSQLHHARMALRSFLRA